MSTLEPLRLECVQISDETCAGSCTAVLRLFSKHNVSVDDSIAVCVCEWIRLALCDSVIELSLSRLLVSEVRFCSALLISCHI